MKIIILQRCSYYSDKGLAEVELGEIDIEKSTAEYFISQGYARADDRGVDKATMGNNVTPTPPPQKR